MFTSLGVFGTVAVIFGGLYLIKDSLTETEDQKELRLKRESDKNNNRKTELDIIKTGFESLTLALSLMETERAYSKEHMDAVRTLIAQINDRDPFSDNRSPSRKLVDDTVDRILYHDNVAKYVAKYVSEKEK